MNVEDTERLVLELFNVGCVKFGEFTLKSGIQSPIYFDLRLLVSFPHLLVLKIFFYNFKWKILFNWVQIDFKKLASNIFSAKINEDSIEYELICGVPYGAISLATVNSKFFVISFTFGYICTDMNYFAKIRLFVWTQTNL